jgi:imidazolonepropionase-like amidohydrolase
MASLALLVILLAAASAGLVAQVAPLPPPPAPEGPVVLLADYALDGRGGVLKDLRIGVARGRITSLHAPAAGRTIDLRGYTVLPGFIDTHVHFDSRFDRTGRIATESEPAPEAAMGMAAAAWETLQAGFTTVQAVGALSDLPLRDAIRERGLPGPRTLTSLDWIEGDGTTSAEELRRLVRQRKEQGADLVKIFASRSQRVGATPTLTEAQLAILCGEAKALGMRSMVHAYRSQVSADAWAGCGRVEHATCATPEELEVAARAGAFLSPRRLGRAELSGDRGPLPRGRQLNRYSLVAGVKP